jgi:hypothetical protein
MGRYGDKRGAGERRKTRYWIWIPEPGQYQCPSVQPRARWYFEAALPSVHTRIGKLVDNWLCAGFR